MKVKEKNKNLLRQLYEYKALLYFYFAMFIYTWDRNQIIGILLFEWLLIFTYVLWGLVKNVYCLYKQEKD